MKISYTWLQKYFTEPLPNVDVLANALTLTFAEVDSIECVGGDWILDVKILPDRACYALSHAGIAREVAAIIQKPLARRTAFDVSVAVRSLEGTTPSFPLTIDTPRCDYYAAVQGTCGPLRTDGIYSEIVSLLLAVGQRSINPLVDIANFVLLDIGQPLHVFDKEKMHGGITVRSAREGEQLTTLDQKELTLSSDDVVIADDNHALALAGIKGGIKAESTVHTTSFVLEAAHFDATHIRRRSTVHGIKTDASKRYENAISSYFAEAGASYALGLMQEICGDVRFDACTIVGTVETQPRKLSITEKGLAHILGIHIPLTTCAEYCSLLGFETEVKDGVCIVSVPAWRHDLISEADMAEEIGRLYGYDRIEPKLLPKTSSHTTHHTSWSLIEYIKTSLIQAGYSEVYTYSLIESGDYEVLAAPAQKNMLRKDLSRKMKEAVIRNTHHGDLLGLQRIALFEIGAVFSREAGEELRLCVGLAPVREKMKKTEAFLQETLSLLEHDLEKVGITFDVRSAMRTADTVLLFEIPLSAIIETEIPSAKEQVSPHVEITGMQTYTPFSPYPYIVRDIAVFVPTGTGSDAIEQSIKHHGAHLVIRQSLFDVFEKKESGMTSYAFRMIFQSSERTLTDHEVDQVLSHIYDDMKRAGYEVR